MTGENMKNLFRYFSILLILSAFLYLSYKFDFLGFRTNFALGFIGFNKNVSCDKKYSEELKVEKDKNDILANEIKKLEKELQTREDFTKEYLEVRVISFEDERLTINHGFSSRLSPKQKVIIGQSLVGEIEIVEKDRSQVILLNNPALKINCNVGKNGKNIWGLLTADSAGNTVFTKVLQNTRLEKGDKIYCEGFYAGDVKSVSKNKTDWFYRAEVIRAVNAENLDTAWIIVSK